MKIDELVNKHYAKLNENDLHIWNYIFEHREVCERLSIDELAARCFISRTTVMRFAQKLGLSGYAELKLYLKLDRDLDKEKQIGFDLFYDRYNQFMLSLKEKNMTKAIELISNAENLYVYGTGIVQNSVASEMKREFLEVGKLINVLRSFQELSVFEQHIHEGDVVILISFSGENKRAIDFAKKLKAKNVAILTITSYKENTLSHLADESFYIEIPRIENSFGSYHDGLAGFFLLIDFLLIKYIEYHERRKPHETK